MTKDYEQVFYWLDAAHRLGSENAGAIIQEMRKRSLGVPFSGEISEPGVKESTAKSYNISYRAVSMANDDIKLKANSVRAQSANPNRCIACGMEALVPSVYIAGAKQCSAERGGCGTTTMIPIIERGLVHGFAMQPYRESIPGRDSNAYSSLGALVHMIKYDSRIDDR